MHIDLNAFFARCEEIRNPSYEKVPLGIGTRGRSGIISTCNYEARKYGVRSGQPTFMADRKCPNLILVPPDFSYYKRMSNQFFNFIRRYSTTIEIVSIDECFVDMTSILSRTQNVELFLKDLQNSLYRETKLRCSIGIAPTKWLAKMASDLKKPMGITICRRKDIPNLIYPLPIESFWGIGNKSSPKLKEYGIKTIGDLANMVNKKDPFVMSLLGKFYFTVKEWINGGGSDVVDPNPSEPKSIGNQETLSKDCSSYEEIEDDLYNLAVEVSSRAKQAKKLGYTITFQIKDTCFKLHSKAHSLSSPTNDATTLFNTSKDLYKQYFEGIRIRLIGISLSRLEDIKKDDNQLNLFNYQEYEEIEKTDKLISSLNRKLKKKALIRASEVKRHGR